MLSLQEVDPGGLYTPKEVAELLNLHPLTVHRMIKQGRLAGVKIGQWRIQGAAILSHFMTKLDKIKQNEILIPPKETK